MAAARTPTSSVTAGDRSRRPIGRPAAAAGDTGARPTLPAVGTASTSTSGADRLSTARRPLAKARRRSGHSTVVIDAVRRTRMLPQSPDEEGRRPDADAGRHELRGEDPLGWLGD